MIYIYIYTFINFLKVLVLRSFCWRSVRWTGLKPRNVQNAHVLRQRWPGNHPIIVWLLGVEMLDIIGWLSYKIFNLIVILLWKLIDIFRFSGNCIKVWPPHNFVWFVSSSLVRHAKTSPTHVVAHHPMSRTDGSWCHLFLKTRLFATRRNESIIQNLEVQGMATYGSRVLTHVTHMTHTQVSAWVHIGRVRVSLCPPVYFAPRLTASFGAHGQNPKLSS